MMNRRALLAAVPVLAAATAAPWSRALSQPARRPLRVVVIGAGIMGASIAYHLAGRGADVLVLERQAPGAGATGGAFAMLVSSHEEGPRALNELYGKAVLDWRRLDMELDGAMRIQWGGALTWAPPGDAADKLRAALRQGLSWGTPLELLSAGDFARLAPGVEPGPLGAGVFSPNHGAVSAGGVLTTLVTAARRRGARFRYPCEVTGLVVEPGRVSAVQTADGPVMADIVVMAAGADTERLAGLAGVRAPHTVASGVLAHSKPMRPILRRVLSAPNTSIKQDMDGRIVTGLSYRPGAVAADVSQQYGETLLATAAKTAPALANAGLETMTIGHTAIPRDGQPIMGFCGAPANLYLALTSSGITMAPLMGRLAAAEIIDGLVIELLAPYRPTRFM